MFKFCLIVAFMLLPKQPSDQGWRIFAFVDFKPTLIKELNEYFLVPQLDSRIRGYEGKEMELEGYFIPVDLDDHRTIIISKSPYSQCFFCGGAGPESVAEVQLTAKPPRFKGDQIIKVSGILKLNSTDFEHMNFILTNAKIIAE